MSHNVKMAFEPESIYLDLADILPLKQLAKRVKQTIKYLQISASIKEVGIIEPPIVTRVPRKRRQFLLLDGHIRISILKELGVEGTDCLVATDDEAFTYNKRINRLASIQEHKMIWKAIERGVPKEQLAKALGINISTIKDKVSMLKGICPEVVELLKDKHCPIHTFTSLRRMNAMRQIEVAELMVSMDNYSVGYAKAMLAATPPSQLAQPSKPKNFKGVSPAQIAQMETEMGKLQQQTKSIEDSYGPNHLNLVLALRYLDRLVANKSVAKYLAKNHGEILQEFKQISEVISMGSEVAS